MYSLQAHTSLRRTKASLKYLPECFSKDGIQSCQPTSSSKNTYKHQTSTLRTHVLANKQQVDRHYENLVYKFLISTEKKCQLKSVTHRLNVKMSLHLTCK